MSTLDGYASGGVFDPYVQGVLPMKPPSPDATWFTVTKAQNGYAINGGDKFYIAKDIDEILDAVKLILVSSVLSASS